MVKKINLKNFFFSCVLIVLNSTVYSAQESELGQTKSYFEYAIPISLFNYKTYILFTYDAETLLEHAASTSNFISSQDGRFMQSLLNENIENIGVGKLNGRIEKQEKNHNSESGMNALNMTELITFFALIKEQSPTNNFDEEVAKKLERSDIYASKYYPQQIKHTAQGRILHLEARVELPELIDHRHELLQVIIFVESSPITIDQNTWASELKQTTINGAGIGINRTFINNFAFQAYFASELEGQVLAISPVLSNLYWIQAVKFF
jgi:hypothetical protein